MSGQFEQFGSSVVVVVVTATGTIHTLSIAGPKAPLDKLLNLILVVVFVAINVNILVCQFIDSYVPYVVPVESKLYVSLYTISA